MPFAATWMDLEIMILSKLNQTERQKLCEVSYMWNLFLNDANVLIQKTETYSQIQRTDSLVTWAEGQGGRLGDQD